MRRIEKQRREDSKEADKLQHCSKCGKELSSDAHFCASCGTPVEPQNSTGTDTYTERKQVFVGAIIKCPNCGEQIGTNTAKCPACGFVIEKRNVSASLDAFIKKLTSFTNDKAKREFIESYAVSNNKEDIRDLLNYAANQRDKDYVDDDSKAYWVDAWNNKCRQIVNQAFDTFGMDEGFSAWLKNYKAGVETSSAENEKLKKKLRFIEAGEEYAASAKKFLKGFGIAVVILAVLGGAGFGIKSCTDKRTAEKQRLAEEEKSRQQELAQLKTEVISLLAKEVTIPKNSVSLGGLLSTYCEVIGDATVTYHYDEHDYENEFQCTISGVVSVPMRLKKDFAAAYNKQYDAFIKKKV
ncbi:MAG: zinc ribbon domain-containing protein [Treponema sp.]|uniref:zinc ribbon domain-containing protein n=1 Tax=Treponema sp. TaxID=166 RepID=UPI003FA2F17B